MDDLISRQAAIDTIIAEGRTVDSHYLESERVINESDAVEALSMLPSVQSEPRWIPVEEGLPDLGIVVWITLALGGRNIVAKSQWNGVDWIYPNSHAKLTLKVTAWMPFQIPKPYERSE